MAPPGGRAGTFITFEGGEGTGKSTQVRHLADDLRAHGLTAVVTREPGGAPAAEQIRGLLVHGEVERWSAQTEALLHYAARREHLDATILPALAAGAWVVCDRFADSTMAYQGYGHGLGRAFIETLHQLVVGAFTPDLTVLLDMPVALGLARAVLRPGGTAPSEDRYERMNMAFHERVRAGFLEIARLEPDRCAVIDGGGEPDRVAAAVSRLVRERLGARLR